MALTQDDLQAIAQLINTSLEPIKEDIKDIKASQRENSNIILAELDRVEQRINDRFERKIDFIHDQLKSDIRLLREEIHITKYSNDTVALLVNKVADLEKRVTELETA